MSLLILFMLFWSLYSNSSLDGDRYFFTIDDHSLYPWIYYMKNKIETRIPLG